MDIERRQDNLMIISDILLKLKEIELTSKFTNEKIDHLAERVEHTNNNTKAFKNLLEEDITDLRSAIQGDETHNVIGLSARLKTFTDEFSNHTKVDAWSFGIMITVLLAILGWTIFK